MFKVKEDRNVVMNEVNRLLALAVEETSGTIIENHDIKNILLQDLTSNEIADEVYDNKRLVGIVRVLILRVEPYHDFAFQVEIEVIYLGYENKEVPKVFKQIVNFC